MTPKKVGYQTMFYFWFCMHPIPVFQRGSCEEFILTCCTSWISQFFLIFLQALTLYGLMIGLFLMLQLVMAAFRKFMGSTVHGASQTATSLTNLVFWGLVSGKTCSNFEFWNFLEEFQTALGPEHCCSYPKHCSQSYRRTRALVRRNWMEPAHDWWFTLQWNLQTESTEITRLMWMGAMVPKKSVWWFWEIANMGLQRWGYISLWFMVVKT